MEHPRKIRVIDIVKLFLVLVTFVLGLIVGSIFDFGNDASIIIICLTVISLILSSALVYFIYRKQRIEIIETSGEDLNATEIKIKNANNKFALEIVNEIKDPLTELKTLLEKSDKNKENDKALEIVDLLFNVIGNLVTEAEVKSDEPIDVPDFSNKTILIVDDIEVNRVVLTTTINMTKANVLEAKDGEEAISVYKNNYQKIDAILMDIRMPKTNGYEATKQIRSLNSQGKMVPIIAITAHVFQEDIFKAFEAGMNDHLSKPIDINQLFLALRKNLVKNGKH